MRVRIFAVATLLACALTTGAALATCIEVTPSVLCIDSPGGAYDLQLSVHNSAGFTLEYAFILGNPVLPQGVSFSLTPAEFLALAPGQTMLLSALVLGAQPGQQVSVFLALHDATLDQCCVVPVLVTFPSCSDPSLIRADCNADGLFNIADPIFLLGYLFSAGVTPLCFDACDSNDDGLTNIADAIRKLSVLFGGGAPPPAPFPGCGVDPTMDQLTCNSFPPCP